MTQRNYLTNLLKSFLAVNMPLFWTVHSLDDSEEILHEDHSAPKELGSVAIEAGAGGLLVSVTFQLPLYVFIYED